VEEIGGGACNQGVEELCRPWGSGGTSTGARVLSGNDDGGVVSKGCVVVDGSENGRKGCADGEFGCT